MSNTTNSNYVPGVCNINTVEIKQRRAAGHIGLAVFIVLFVGLVLLDIGQFARIILLAPALLAAIGYLQAKNKFCVGYGSAGMQHADEDDAAIKTAAEAAAKDAKRAKQLNRQALLIAVAVTAIAIVLPV